MQVLYELENVNVYQKLVSGPAPLPCRITQQLGELCMTQLISPEHGLNLR